MPIRVKNDLPVKERLEHENIFVMDENRAEHQDIRAIEIAILNLMPLKEDTELQILRELSNTPLQINVTFMRSGSHESKNVSRSHLDSFYYSFSELKHRNFDGMIITGAPVEELEFEEVDYWEELTEIFDWCDDHVTSTIFLCWAAQAALYHFYGLPKVHLPQKLVGIYDHHVFNRKVPLVRGFDDIFLAPHSRYTETPADLIQKCGKLTVLAYSEKAGVFLSMAENGRKIFVSGHPEYGRTTLRKEYIRDVGKGLNPDIPYNYFPGDDPEKEPVLTWRSHANNLYTNWLNYYVYQTTPYALDGTPGGGRIKDNFTRY
ncbi:MAG: homoserine O-succinyltransferase [Lachnospiraceae bacterium]|nr:homoserine O-succinyltransferase [Lachnospiraceae bacterium]